MTVKCTSGAPLTHFSTCLMALLDLNLARDMTSDALLLFLYEIALVWGMNASAFSWLKQSGK